MANLTQHDVVTATAAALTAGIAGVTVYPWRMLALSDDLLPAVVVHCFDRQETPRTVEVQNSQWRSVDTVHIECHNRASSDAAAGQEASRLADAVKDALWASQAWADEWETVSPMRTRLVLDEGTDRRRIVAIVECDVQHHSKYELPDGVPIDFIRLSIEPISPDGADVTAQVDL